MMKELRRLFLNDSVFQWMTAVFLGTLLASLIQLFFKDVIVPLFGSLSGLRDISEMTVNVNQGRLLLGEFLSAFFAVVFGVWLIQWVSTALFKMRMDETLLGQGLRRTRNCSECLSLVPLEARRCAFCASELTPIFSLKSEKIGNDLR